MRGRLQTAATLSRVPGLAGCDTLPDNPDVTFNWPDRPPSLFTVVNKTALERMIISWYDAQNSTTSLSSGGFSGAGSPKASTERSAEPAGALASLTIPVGPNAGGK